MIKVSVMYPRIHQYEWRHIRHMAYYLQSTLMPLVRQAQGQR